MTPFSRSPSVDGLYVGLMSGTSMDGIDAVLVEFRGERPTILSSSQTPWPPALRERLQRLSTPGPNEIEALGQLDTALGKRFAEATLALLRKAGTTPRQVQAVGSHGQTVRHRPSGELPFTLQLGDPNQITYQTGITTVADFRRRDMAAGGEGAPLAPALHQSVLASEKEYRAILNIGGIANLTLIPPAGEGEVSGFDTGPGNTLLDYWVNRHLGHSHDEGGSWGAQGTIQPLLYERLWDGYFSRPPPKSTGTDYFSPTWLIERLPEGTELSPVDVQATLVALTADTITQTLLRLAPRCQRVIACGGGVHNQGVMARMRAALGEIPLETTDQHGIPADLVEAVAFAWLARQTLARASGNIPSVTGAREPVVLGGVYFP